MANLDFVKMKPNNSVIKGGAGTAPLTGNPPEARMTVRALVDSGRAYAIYLKGGTQAELKLDMPVGRYVAEWVNTKTGKVDADETIDHPGGERLLKSPAYTDDIALRIKRSP